MLNDEQREAEDAATRLQAISRGHRDRQAVERTQTLKKERETERIRELYREYGEMLRQKALKKMAETEAASTSAADAPPQGDAQPTESR